MKRTDFNKMSAMELQQEMDSVESYRDYLSPQLHAAIKEIERLRIVCQDIIEVIGVEYAAYGNPDYVIEKIDDLAHKYYEPKK